MGKIDLLEIHLDKEISIYTPGESLSGKLHVQINERLKINSVYVRAMGAARVHWSEKQGRGEGRVVHFEAYEEYLNFEFVFLKKESNDDLYMEVGKYSYPFQFNLKDKLPTSFEHNFGRIRYSIIGTIDIPWAFDKHVQKNITVISPIDLNLNPQLRKSYSISDSRRLCCWCCTSDPITASLSVSKCGFVPGEGIVFKSVIHNKSNRNIHTLKAMLFQHVTLRSTKKERTWSREIAEIVLDKDIAEQSEETWDGIFVVPAVCASSTKTCSIIDISYTFVLDIDPNGPNMEISLSVPIFIGTIPLTKNECSPQFMYQASKFEKSDEIDENLKGEVVNMDKEYTPSYPYYEDLTKAN